MDGIVNRFNYWTISNFIEWSFSSMPFMSYMKNIKSEDSAQPKTLK